MKKRLMVQVPEEMYLLLKETADYQTMQNGGVRQVTISELLRGGMDRIMRDTWGEEVYKEKLAEIRERLNHSSSFD